VFFDYPPAIRRAVYKQHLQSLRQNTLPVELINRSLLMGHEYLPCSLV